MIAQALKQFGMAFGVQRVQPALSPMLFEVQLIGDASGQASAVPLCITTDRPLEVARELMRDRDPRVWDVDIRPIRGPRIS